MAAGSADSDPAAIHTRVRRLINTVEFQLQQLEQEAAFPTSIALVRRDGAGGGAGVSTDGAGGLDVAMRRQQLSDNTNLLTNEVSALARAVQLAFVAGPPTKRELWRKCVTAGCSRFAADCNRHRSRRQHHLDAAVGLVRKHAIGGGRRLQRHPMCHHAGHIPPR